MKRAVAAAFVACVFSVMAEEPAWPEDFWEQVAAGRAAAAAKGSVAEPSSNALTLLDTFARIWAYSRGIDFRSDKSGAVIILR